LDAPAVVLEPRERAAARVVVVVDGEQAWWLRAGEGPSYEFYEGMREDRYALLKRLVKAVVSGEYEHRWEERSHRFLLMPWRRRTVPVWVATFGVGADSVFTEHYTNPLAADDLDHRRFAPYLAR
jgi:hypothetical protein